MSALIHPEPRRSKVNSNKLLLSKWTATRPKNKEKHFIVTKLIVPESELEPIREIEMEAVYSGKIYRIEWRQLSDTDIWSQGW